MATVVAPIPHLRPPREPRPNTSTDVDRNSNALRASVLQTALDIGFGTNTTVANWIFNNPLTEEEEPEETPSLTYASTATSEESDATRSPHSSAGADPTSLAPFSAPVPFPTSDSDITINTNFSPIDGPRSTPNIQYPPGFNPFDRSYSATPTRDGYGAGQTPNKLRKIRRIDDGYESEGYLSEGGKKKKEKSIGKKEMKKEKSTKKRGNDEVKDEASEFNRVPETVFESLPKAKFAKSKSIKSSKSTTSTPKKSKLTSNSPPPSPTLSPKRVKTSKSLSFFRLSHKASKEKTIHFPEEMEKEIPPPLPSMPAPIFERFARIASPMPVSPVSAPGPPERTSQESSDSGTGMNTASLPKLGSDCHGDGASMLTSLSTTTPSVTATAPPREALSMSISAHSHSSLTPVTSSDDRSSTPSYVLVTPASSSVNLPSDSASNPYNPTRNPLQKLMKNIPAPLSLHSHQPAPGPTYTISHPNTNPNSRDPSPAPLSSTSSYAIVSHPYAGTDTNSATLAPPRALRRRSLVISSDITDVKDISAPNVLAYYDIPPPSPPPTCPLPRVPKTNDAYNLQQSAPPAQRGRIAPFPSKSVPEFSAPIDLGGFQRRVDMRRYGDLYASPPEPRNQSGQCSDSGSVSGSHESGRMDDAVRQARRRGGFIEHLSPQISAEDDAGDYEVDEDCSLDNILSRYAEFRHRQDDGSDDESHYAPSDREEAMYGPGRSTTSLDRSSFGRPSMDIDDEGRRYGQYAESVYSIIDDERSYALRDRFVRRVQALYGSDGREQSDVPPVPKLPEGLRTMGIGRGTGRI